MSDTSVASHVWTRMLLEGEPLAGLILESPYLSVLRSRTGSIPAVGGLVRGILRDQDMFDNRKGLKNVGRIPLLVLAGSADEVIPAAQARELHDEYRGVDKDLLVLPGAVHNNLGDWPHGLLFWPRVTSFVHRISPPSPGAETAPGAPPTFSTRLFPEVTLQSLFGTWGLPDAPGEGYGDERSDVEAIGVAGLQPAAAVVPQVRLTPLSPVAVRTSPEEPPGGQEA